MSVKIGNRDTLLEGDESSRRADAVDIVEDALSAVSADRLIDDAVARSGDIVTIDGRTYDLGAVGEVFVVAAGKGSGALASSLLRRLDGRVTEAIVFEKDASTVDSALSERPSDGFTVLEAGHPIPTNESRTAAARVLTLADRAGTDDLVICCITGGTSALLAAPDGIGLDSLSTTNEALLGAGAPIEDVNAVRKHLSKIKGGFLAERLAPASVVSLIVVDEVAGEPWGPTAPDSTTYADALGVLDRYDLRNAVPSDVRERIEQGMKSNYPETLDENAIADLPVRNVVLADASSICRPAADAARERGYEPLVLSTRIEGEASEIGLVHAGIATDAIEAGRPIDPPMALITGGETTVTVEGDGRGGPNQETALGFARGVDGWSGVVGAFVGTDGTDGPTELAGGIATGRTRQRAKNAGVPVSDALDRNDAAATLKALGDAIVTGPTETNLMDLRVVLVGEQEE